MLRDWYFNVCCLLAVIVPFVALVVGAAMAWGQGVGAAELVTCATMFVLTLIGIEVGYHRQFSHRSFRAHPSTRYMLAALGCMAFQGKVIWWAGVHRAHHKFSDREGDPHSPLNGLWLAHFGWLFQSANPQRWTRRVRDLLRDPVAVAAHRMYYVWFAVGLALPAVVVGLLSHSWAGVGTGLLWGGQIRMFLVNHVMWSTNSICHHFGDRTFHTRDESRNNVWLLLPSLGTSLHNNHHAFPYAAVNSRDWWQVDLCGCVIRALEAIGLAWDVRMPTRAEVARKRIGGATTESSPAVRLPSAALSRR